MKYWFHAILLFMNNVKMPRYIAGGIALSLVITMGVGCYGEEKRTEPKNTIVEDRSFCLSLPHSEIVGNDLKNYISCMMDRGQPTVQTDIEAFSIKIRASCAETAARFSKDYKEEFYKNCVMQTGIRP